MSRDDPARNPNLNPAGLPAAESRRHVQGVGGSPSTVARRELESEASGTCQFVSSHGGTLRCQDEPYQSGFCRFHHRCLVQGEISPLGRITDVVQDQERRRAINHHGLRLPSYDRLDEDPVTGKPQG